MEEQERIERERFEREKEDLEELGEWSEDEEVDDGEIEWVDNDYTIR